MKSYKDLIEASKTAQAKVANLEADMLTELLAAKAAHRDDPSPANRERKAAAVKAIRECRAYVRKGRTSLLGGDVHLSTEQNGG